MLGIAQIGLNTCDIPGSLRLYSEVLGFRNAGGQALWGQMIGIQGLPPESRALMWWMVGDQPFFQLELFQHTNPRQRPVPADRRPCDLGWNRFGFLVANLENAVSALKAGGVDTFGPPSKTSGARRVAFLDPFVGVVVELVEVANGRGNGGSATFLYAASSVSDLSGARNFYEKTLGFEIAPLETLHGPDADAIWGLPGARREGFLVRFGQAWFEIVKYADPVGRPLSPDHRISDQGIMNMALGSRSREAVSSAIERLRKAGHALPNVIDSEMALAGYLTEPERELELLYVPEASDTRVGFAATVPFFT